MGPRSAYGEPAGALEPDRDPSEQQFRQRPSGLWLVADRWRRGPRVTLNRGRCRSRAVLLRMAACRGVRTGRQEIRTFGADPWSISESACA